MACKDSGTVVFMDTNAKCLHYLAVHTNALIGLSGQKSITNTMTCFPTWWPKNTDTCMVLVTEWLFQTMTENLSLHAYKDQ